MTMYYNYNYVVAVLVCSTLVVMQVSMVTSGSASLVDQCMPDIQNLGNCLMFVTGKQAEPSKACCNTVSGIKDTRPVCLCFIIARAHNGTDPMIKTSGIQESKLLQLPASCHFTNATLTNCPSLLNISPKSEAAAIFLNATSSSSPATSNSNTDSSSGIKNHPNAGFLTGTIIFTLSALVTIIIPVILP